MRLVFAFCTAFLILSACSKSEKKPDTLPALDTVETVSDASKTDISDTDKVAPAKIEYTFEGLPEPYGSAKYNVGRRVFRLCSTCHFLNADMGHSVGPNLYGVFGRQVGTAEGFNYSRALQEADFDWSPEKLDAWLQSPRKFLPKNRMQFSGVRKVSERNAVIAYIMKETGYQTED